LAVIESHFVAGYTAPAGGLAAWAQPSAAAPSIAHIEARVELHLVERSGDWAHIECSNGWQAWVDARLLAPVAATPAPPRRPNSAVNLTITTIGRYTVTLADVLAAVGVALSALLPWLRGAGGKSTGFDVPLAFLVHTSAQRSDLSVGVLLAVAAFVAVAAPSRALRVAAYVVALAALVDYAIQLKRLVDQAPAGPGLGSVLGVGVYVGIAAAGVGLLWTLLRRDLGRRQR
jgi:hypothetical protein